MTVEAIREQLREVLGIDPDSLSQTALRGAVRKRMEVRDLDSREVYAELLRTDSFEFEQLANAVVVHETSFFRYPAAFELLAQDARTRTEGSPSSIYRTLCVACSTGEEPASVVMSLLEAGLPPERIRVEATDVSARAIAYAEAGAYRRRGVLRLPGPVRDRWFEDEGDHFRLDPRVTACVRFGRANALEDGVALSKHRHDAIFCRNLMIYLVPEARERLLKGLIQRLRPGGLLFVGHAEMPVVRAHGLALAAPPDAFAGRLVPAERAAPGTAARPVVSSVRPRVVASAPTPRSSAVPGRAAPNTSPRARTVAAPAEPAQSGVLERAAQLADAGALEEARRLLRDRIQRGAPCPDHYHLLAVIEGARGREVASGDALRRALYLDPEHYPSLVQLALQADARGDKERAQRARAKAERVRSAQDAAGSDGREGGGR